MCSPHAFRHLLIHLLHSSALAVVVIPVFLLHFAHRALSRLALSILVIFPLVLSQQPGSWSWSWASFCLEKLQKPSCLIVCFKDGSPPHLLPFAGLLLIIVVAVVVVGFVVVFFLLCDTVNLKRKHGGETTGHTLNTAGELCH